MNEIFCSAPWTSLFIDTNGEVKPCCAARGPLGNIKDNTVEEIINAPFHKEVKQALLDGVKHPHCSYCYEAEAASGQSTRLWFNEHTTLPSYPVDQYQLQMIDIRWSNHCNLRCLYCNPNSSSSIAEHWDSLPQDIFTKYSINYAPGRKQSVRQWQDEIMQLVKDNILTIKEVYMLGGEPLLIKENLALAELLTDQHISVVTNLSLDNTNNKIYQVLVNKPNVHWSVSLEQTGQKFEYIRNGASWQQILTNIADLQRRGREFSFASQYCLYNAFDLLDVLTELMKYAPVDLNFLVGPPSLVVTNYSERIRRLAITELDRVLSEVNSGKLGVSDHIVSVVHQLKQSLIDANTNRKYEKAHAKAFIELQQLNPGPLQFKDLWPEVWQILLEDANEEVD